MNKLNSTGAIVLVVSALIAIGLMALSFYAGRNLTFRH